MQQPTVYDHRNVYDNGGGGSNPLFREQIKSNIYTFTKIGNLYFTIDNLREDFTGIATSYSAGNPYRQIVTGYDVFGFYYNNLSVDIIKQWLIDNNSDWRIATREDFETLIDYKLNTLKLPIVWNDPSENNNKTGFSCLGSGYYAGQDYRQLNENAYFITTTKEDSKNYYVQINDNNERNLVVTNIYFNAGNSWPIRLVKDV